MTDTLSLSHLETDDPHDAKTPRTKYKTQGGKQLPEYRLWIRLTTLLITSKDVYPLHQPVNGLHEVLRLLIGKTAGLSPV